MSYILTHGDGPDGAWMIANRHAEWFFNLLLKRPDVDAEVAHRLEMSLYVHGLILHKLDADLTQRLVLYVRRVCDEIIRGDHGPIEPRLLAHFVDLAGRLSGLSSAG
jgi:hypothetical protein